MVIFSPEADTDLEQISNYIANHNPGAALAFVRELREKCYRLADAPLGYPLLPHFEHLGIRRRPVGHYLILYRVNHTIEVVRILHAARDYEQLLE
jgi:plasmid stabilization system protein ParE